MTDLRAALEKTLGALDDLGVRLVNDHRGIPYDVIADVDAIAAALRDALAASQEPESGGLALERLAVSAAARMEGEVSILRTQLAACTESAALGLAWAEAEAALPEAGWLASDARWVIPSGRWAISIERRPDSGDGYSEPHYPPAYFATARVHGPEEYIATGLDADSPAAALQALAARLREHTDGQ